MNSISSIKSCFEDCFSWIDTSTFLPTSVIGKVYLHEATTWGKVQAKKISTLLLHLFSPTPASPSARKALLLALLYINSCAEKGNHFLNLSVL